MTCDEAELKLATAGSASRGRLCEGGFDLNDAVDP